VKKILLILLFICFVSPSYAAFPTEGSPWAMTPETSTDSFSDGFTNNTGSGTFANDDTYTFALVATNGRHGAWFKNQDFADSNQTVACRVRLISLAGEQLESGPSTRHNEGAFNDAVDYLYLISAKSPADGEATSVYYGSRTNGSGSSEGVSNETPTLSTYYEFKLSVTGTGAGGTTMYGWIDGVALNTASVSGVTAGDDTELSGGFGGYSTSFDTVPSGAISVDNWWAEAFTPPSAGRRIMVISKIKKMITNFFVKEAIAQERDETIKYYICPNIGDGTNGNYYRPKIHDIAKDNKLKIGYDTEIKLIPRKIIGGGADPASDWALVKVKGTEEEHLVLSKDKEVTLLPDKNPTDKLTSLSISNLLSLNTILSNKEIATVDANTDMQTLIKKIGSKAMGIAEENYNEKAFLNMK